MQEGFESRAGRGTVWVCEPAAHENLVDTSDEASAIESRDSSDVNRQRLMALPSLPGHCTSSDGEYEETIGQVSNGEIATIDRHFEARRTHSSVEEHPCLIARNTKSGRDYGDRVVEY